MPDGGPVYMETHPGNFIVEPWNGFSSLLMLIPAIYWLYRMRKDGFNSTLLIVVALLVILGGLGSGLFHAFRVSRFFLFMDIIPTGLLTVTLAVYFWIKVLKRWWYVLFIYTPILASRFTFWNRLPDFMAINLSYFITGLSIGLPLIIYLFQTRFKNWKLAAFGIISFAAALSFRQLDSVPSFLPMGTHFLWHAFAAIGAYFILAFLYLSYSEKVDPKHQ